MLLFHISTLVSLLCLWVRAIKLQFIPSEVLLGQSLFKAKPLKVFFLLLLPETRAFTVWHMNKPQHDIPWRKKKIVWNISYRYESPWPHPRMIYSRHRGACDSYTLNRPQFKFLWQKQNNNRIYSNKSVEIQMLSEAKAWANGNLNDPCIVFKLDVFCGVIRFSERWI